MGSNQRVQSDGFYTITYEKETKLGKCCWGMCSLNLIVSCNHSENCTVLKEYVI